MRMFSFILAMLAGVAAIAALAPALHAQGPQPWDVASGDWNEDSNWLNVVVPDASFGDTALINNGGEATLNVPASFSVGGVSVGPGRLSLTSNGSVTAIDATGSDPTATGFFSTSGAGTLVMADNASVSAQGPVNLSGATNITGPNASFSASGNFSFGLSSVYNAGITDSASHSLISVDGVATLRGTLNAAFSGFTPSSGDSWTLVDAATLDGEFGSVNVSGIPAGLGLAGAVTTSPGGKGTLAQLTIQSRLVLEVDRQTGATTLRNFGAAPIAFEGYSVASSLGTLDGADGAWNSLEDQGVANWVETPTTANGIAELNNAEGGNLAVAGGANRTLGNAFDPLLPFGSPSPEDLVFEYRDATAGVVQGIVEYVGEIRANNLVLTVDPATGNAQVRNASPDIPVALQGYTVTSADGSLLTTFDSTLPDSDWAETAGSANGVGELNFTTGETTLAPGDTFDLSGLFAPGGTQDLVFQFRRLAAEAGDFNEDGVVDGDDLNGSPQSWESRYGDDLGGDDLLDWQRALGEESGGQIVTGLVSYNGNFPAAAGAAAVPEPSAAILLALASAAVTGRRRN